MKLISKILISASVVLASLSASAGITVSHSFGDLAAANFGGSGISNDHTAITTIKNSYWLFGNRTDTVTLGLTATLRYAPGTLANDGNGNFAIWDGADPTANPAEQLARWNFGFYIGGSSNAAVNAYRYQLSVDVDPTAGEVIVTLPLFGARQNSWNLGFDSFELLGSYGFDPMDLGTYNFKLKAINWITGATVGSTEMNVTVVPEPATLALVGLALAGVGFASRRRKA